MSRGVKLCLAALILICFPGSLMAQQWRALGPDGGSVRSLALDPANPDRVFLGTSAGRLYISNDGGRTWSRFAHLGTASEMVLDHVVLDPANPQIMYVAGWNAQSPGSDGEMFRSKDGGKTWDLLPDLHGKSIRALAIAPSDHRILIVGALDGIFRSRDGGDNWERISPENHAEIKNVESIAIDPANPDVIYAGTWHLPWKTEDGGKNWHNIKRGVIDDSDVFSIVLDSSKPSSVYISACSGIYKSDSAGELFRKIQGIPYSARRTRTLKMDPADHNILYAGTTEGLWKTTDAGASWKRMTGSDVVVNDVLIDPRRSSRVLLATDRIGVLASDDGAQTFTASNRGFTHRQVSALLVDRRDSSTLYAGLLNDKEFGGVFISRDAGETWKQLSDGLDGRDVFVLRQAYDNSLLAATDRGIFQMKEGNSAWLPVTVQSDNVPAQGASKKKRQGQSAAGLVGRILGLEVTPERWFAATDSGLFTTSDAGNTWRKELLPQIKYPKSIAADGKMVVVAGRNAIAVSVNGGETWLEPKPLGADFLINSASLDASGAGTIWLAARDGIYRSTDLGDTWKRVNSLRLSNVASVQVDHGTQRVLAVGAASSNVYESLDNGRTWSPINSGWLLLSVSISNGRLLGTTPFDGVVIQPAASASAAPEITNSGAQ